MMPIRLVAVLTHPIQYYGPWFRHIAARCPEIDLNVIYAVAPNAEQQGAGFERAFSWDTPLTEEYQHHIIRPARSGEEVLSSSFRGVDVPEIADAIRDAKPDVVLIPGWYSITLVRALLACRRMGIPVLYRGDTHRTNALLGWRRIVWETRTWTILRLFSAYLSVGKRSRDYLRHFAIPETKIFSSPHCIDNEFFSTSASAWQNGTRAAARRFLGVEADDFVVLFAGKLEDKKRPLDAIRAVQRLGYGTTLLVAGSGRLEDQCRAEAAKHRVRVAWAGFLNQTEIGCAYAAADCLVLPSNWGETWGLVVNEAMAAGLPCVVSDRVGCAPDLIAPGDTGESFPMGDCEALADALRRVRERLANGENYSAACRARANEHSFERATTGLIAACQSVTRPRRSGTRVIACCGGMVIVSGLERMTFEVLRVLRSRGVPVHCVLNGWNNQRIVALAEPLGASWSTGYYLTDLRRRFRNPMQLVHNVWDVFRTSLGFLWDALNFRPTHVLLPEFTAVLRNAPALALLRLLGVRVILRVGNAPARGAFYRFVWRWCVSPFVDRIVGNSRFIQEEVLAHGVPACKITCRYNAVSESSEPSTVALQRVPGKLVFAGQIIPEKGVHLLLEAVSLLTRSGYDVTLDVVGQVEGWVSPSYEGYRETLIKRAEKADLKGRIRFLGWRSDVVALLGGAAVHCCPSLPEQREGAANVVLEAKSAGTPSVVFPTGALRELISHRKDGWICSSVSASAMAEGIAFFLDSSSRRGEAGEAARQSLQLRFSRTEFEEGWLSMFGLHPRELRI